MVNHKKNDSGENVFGFLPSNLERENRTSVVSSATMRIKKLGGLCRRCCFCHLTLLLKGNRLLENKCIMFPVGALASSERSILCQL